MGEPPDVCRSPVRDTFLAYPPQHEENATGKHPAVACKADRGSPKDLNCGTCQGRSRSDSVFNDSRNCRPRFGPTGLSASTLSAEQSHRK